MKFHSLAEQNWEGRPVLVRLDLNVPLKNGQILDDSRIQAALPTIRYLLRNNARIALMSHLGRPKGKPEQKYSLAPVGEHLAELLGCEVLLVSDFDKEPADQLLRQLSKNQILLYENLRFYPGETQNDVDFAHRLVKGADFFVNDAFGAIHRTHASVVAAPGLFPPEKRFVGQLISHELQALDEIRNTPKAPFTAIIGGAKVSDKIGIILSLINQCNDLLIGGAMAYTLLKFKGFNTGQSRVEEDKLDLCDAIFRSAQARKVTIHLPEDHICATDFAEGATPQIVDDYNIPEELMGLDIGPKTQARFKSVIRKSETVLWNGPMGVFEWEAFAGGSVAVAKELAECRGYTVVGGGESVAAATKAGIVDRLSHVSTGGGAALEYLQGLTLPGLKAMQDNSE